MRGSLDAATRLMVDVVLRAYGFSLADLLTWGGQISEDQPMPDHPSRLGRLASGDIDAIFDEGIVLWADRLASVRASFLPLDPEHLQVLVGQGFRPGIIEASRYPSLSGDVATVDYSGWPIYCRSDTPDELVEVFCRSLHARRNSIVWDTGALAQEPLPLARMVAESPATPQDVPVHPRAATVWRELDYLS